MEKVNYVFQHKKESDRIKMIEASNKMEAKEKLKDRLLKGYKSNFGIYYESIDDYQYSFMI